MTKNVWLDFALFSLAGIIIAALLIAVLNSGGNRGYGYNDNFQRQYQMQAGYYGSGNMPGMQVGAYGQGVMPVNYQQMPMNQQQMPMPQQQMPQQQMQGGGMGMMPMMSGMMGMGGGSMPAAAPAAPMPAGGGGMSMM